MYSFFSYIDFLKSRLSSNKVFLAFDGGHSFKSSIDISYKNKRRKSERFSEKVKLIYDIVLTLSNYYVIINKNLEADDVSFCFCRDNNHCICVSEDYDWLYNLTANSDINVYRNKTIVSKENFEFLFNYPLEKIELDLFLRGDIKDNVRKPFRLRGSILENIHRYKNINEYILKNKLENPEVSQYKNLIFPVSDQPYRIMEGRKNSKTQNYINHYNLDFLRSQLVEEQSLI